MSASTSASPPVLLTITKYVATLTLNRPNRGNALNAAVITLLQAHLSQLASDPRVHVVILTGSGKYFCTGMDLASGPASDSSAAQRSFREGIKLYDTLALFPKPLVARINGPVLGGGLGLVFTTNIRVALRSSYFALTEVKRGLIPAIISRYIVPEVGSFRANEYMLTGRRVSAAEFVSAGFVTCVVDTPEELDSKTAEYVDMLLTSAPGAMRNIKELVRVVAAGGRGDEAEERVRTHVEGAFLGMMKSEEAAYGIMCFAQKVDPDWTRREEVEEGNEPKAKL
ncbi:ClpP/crotonase-like domain-containing protein [Jimgerdemannia flammicorona]|uniref:ClpP/crotonase-like domain-containing protein n=1 Tax=Jimgerdemannia flammicorona TaxID=994334 RepID=A0A433DAF0_9FUNG|nr:ClpP/crotonase-like domain-containing protein [Jimgerdemannia flammicorona]